MLNSSPLLHYSQGLEIYILISGGNILNYNTTTMYKILPQSIQVKSEREGNRPINLIFDDVMAG